MSTRPQRACQSQQLPPPQNAFTHVLRAGLLLAAFGGLVRAQPGVESTVQAAVEMTFKLLGS